MKKLSKVTEVWNPDNNIYTGYLTDYVQLYDFDGIPAAYCSMNSQYWYQNHKQIQFMERFTPWANIGVHADVSDKQHSANGDIVVFGSGYFKAYYGIQIGGQDFNIGSMAGYTLSNSFTIDQDY